MLLLCGARRGPQRMPDRRVIHAPAAWRALRGHVHGLAQASVQGGLEVGAVSPELLAQVDAVFAPLVGPLPDALTLHLGPCALAHRALYWSGALQRAENLSVSARHHLGPVQMAADGHSHFVATLPAPHAKAALVTLAVVMQMINRSAGVDPDQNADTNDHRKALAHLRKALKPFAVPGQNTPFLLNAALAAELPVQRVSAMVLRLGWGQRQRLFASTLTDRSLTIGAMLARDKHATAALLRQWGLPGAVNMPVRNADDAVAKALKLGFAVVVKPMDLDGGLGVAADLRDEASVRQAYAHAAALSPKVLIERHVQGTGHRLAVAFGRVIKATAKLPWGVVGDGQATIKQLLQADAAARAALPTGAVLSPVKPIALSAWAFDDEALGLLAQSGLSLSSVPADQAFIALRRRNNAIAGGTTKRLELDAVHADNLELAVRASAALMLDVAGVDLILADIGRSWTEQDALICEVNAQPQVDAKTMATILLQAMQGSDGRIPVWLILMRKGAKAPDDAQAHHIMQRLGADALSTHEAVWLQGRRVAARLQGAWHAAEVVLNSPQASSAVLVLALDDVVTHGLPVDRLSGCTVAPDVASVHEALRTVPQGVVHVAQGWTAQELLVVRRATDLMQAHLFDVSTDGLTDGLTDRSPEVLTKGSIG